MIKINTKVILTAMALLAPVSVPGQSVPPLVNYQGRLTDQTGAALSAGQYTIQFRLWDSAAASGANLIWDQEQNVAVQSNGVFNVILGAPGGTSPIAGTTPATNNIAYAFGGGNCFLGLTVTVANGVTNPTPKEILPRQQLLAVPFAFSAATAASVAPRSITPDALASDPASLLQVSGGQIINRGGNIGIGTLWPEHHLSVDQPSGDGFVALFGPTWNNGNAYHEGDQRVCISAWNGKPGLSLGVNGGGGYLIEVDSSGSLSFKQQYDGSGGEHMRIDPTGNVGIGTSNPQCPLDVEASASNDILAMYGILQYNGAKYYQSPPTSASLSIRTPQAILANTYIIASDQRGKQVVGRSDPRADLETVRQLQVTDYRHIDSIAKGAGLRKGFIAQEVARVVPEAVTSTPDFIPNIYALATGVEFDPGQKTLALTLAKPHELAVGDKVRLYTDSKRAEATVLRVPTESQFVVSDWDNAVDRVFVYGKYVTDYLTLDYDRLFTTGIGAIQELAKQNDAKEARITQLESYLPELRTLVHSQRQEIDVLKNELEMLKATLRELGEQRR